MNTRSLEPVTVLITADAVVDGEGLAVVDAAILLRLSTPAGWWLDGQPLVSNPPQVAWGERWADVEVLAVGARREVEGHPAVGVGTKRVDLAGHVLIPGLVNAHTHLDLTHIGPRPHDPAQGFAGFAKIVMGNRRQDEAGIRASVRDGIERSLNGGGVATGDIAGFVPPGVSLHPLAEMRASAMMGVSYPEFFCMGRRGEERLVDVLGPWLHAVFDESIVPGVVSMLRSVTGGIWPARRAGSKGERVGLGLSPHAPYSVDAAGYTYAAGLCEAYKLPLQTHLAESLDEREAIVEGRGALIEMLRGMGLYDDRAQAWFGKAKSSVHRLEGDLREAGSTVGPRCAAVHCNDVSDEDLEVLKEAGCAVIYCPRSSAYFGHEQNFGPHRYREMVARGIPVALGTDSIINLPAGSETISTLDEMRFLSQRDGTDPLALLRMATTTGARVLGLNEGAFTLQPRQGRAHWLAGLVALPLSRKATDGQAALSDALGQVHGGARLVVVGSCRSS